MDIRLINPEDAELYRIIRMEALTNNPEAFAATIEEEKTKTIEQYKTQLGMEYAFTFGAFAQDTLAGIITLRQETLWKMRHRATILSMYVSPAHRNSGTGKALIKRAIQQAKELKAIEQIYLTVVTTNISAKKLYSSFGFEVFAYEKNAFKLNDTYIDEERMVLFL